MDTKFNSNSDRRSRSRERQTSRTRSSSYSDFSSPSPPPPHAHSTQPPIARNKVFVERLTKNVNEAHLREIFGAYGKVVNVRHSKARGWAHVEYVGDEAATQAIHCMDGGQIDGNYVDVSSFKMYSRGDDRHRQTHSRSNHHHSNRKRSASPRSRHY